MDPCRQNILLIANFLNARLQGTLFLMRVNLRRRAEMRLGDTLTTRYQLSENILVTRMLRVHNYCF